MKTGKMAFLILAHTDPLQLKRLIYALDDPYFDIYVHIDARSDIRSFHFKDITPKYSKLYVLDNRIKTLWGDFSIVKATFLMYQAASNSGENYIRYITLSGMDYPLASNKEIYQLLSKSDTEFIMGNPVKDDWKTRYYHYLSRNKVEKALLWIPVHLKFIRNKKPLTLDGKEYMLYFAPQWHALSKDCVSYLLKTYCENEKAIYRYYKYSYAPDELLIPTLVFNNKQFHDSALENDFPPDTHYNDKCAIHCIDYPGIVKVFDENDAEELFSSNKLFTRKICSGKSDKLVRIIDEHRRS